ncbi:3'-5' exonuclease [Spirobacillus cienkowskii]|uniref:3'-5' exonuclease n=1 Tax=Spirobacillus cienkowskii TaxID=495820 RepID=UPI0030CE8882
MEKYSILAIRLRLNLKDWVDGKKLCSVLKINPPDTWGNENILQELVPKIIHQNILFPELQIMLLNLIHKLDLNDPNITKFCIEIENKIKELVAKNSQNSSLLNELDISLNELNEFKTNWIIFKKKGLGISLSAFRNAMALGQINEDYKSNGLTLSTVHTMKGLEKDIVFLIGMCEGVFPDYRARNKKEIDEERNSAFVAITRSRRWIYITYPETRIMPWGDVKPQTQSRFITEMLS